MPKFSQATSLSHDNVNMSIFEELESEVRSYCRSFPTIFTTAKGHHLWDVQGKSYLDFFSGAGTLNYGHNDPDMQKSLIQFIQQDQLVHSLDMSTKVKRDFLEVFNEWILKPRKLSYKIMFPGPTGTNAIESALKIARKVTGRKNIVSFTNAFHGMSLGSLGISGNRFKRKGAGVPLEHSLFIPYDNYLGEDIDTVQILERYIEDDGSGFDLPAAVIVETVQGEGGVNVASDQWLKRIEEVCRKWDILLIVDDIQVGCGRTGPFFSFERAGITPDIICLSKSLSGYGLPFSLTLIRPELDQWAPGEHNGTFRGNNFAFLTAIEAIKKYWTDTELTSQVLEKGELVRQSLNDLILKYPELKGEVRGIGLIQGLLCKEDGLAEAISKVCFGKGLIIETSGAKSQVLKVMPPLTIDHNSLLEGIDIISSSIQEVVGKK